MNKSIGAQVSFDSRLRPGTVGSRLAGVNERETGEVPELKLFLTSHFRQRECIGRCTADHGRSKIAHHAQTLDGIPSATRNHHRANLFRSLDGGPETDERAE